MSPEKYRNYTLLILLFIAFVSYGFLEWHERKNVNVKLKKLPCYGHNFELPPLQKIKKKPKEKKKIFYSIALVIDDVGNGRDIVYKVSQLPTEVTPSILPFRKYSLWATLYLKSRGFDVMLHLPMEPQNPELREKGMLMVGMSRGKMEQLLKAAFRDVPLPVGINNHEGSLFTSDRQSMERFLSLIKGKDIFFLDSWTCGNSVAEDMARRMGIPTLRRDVFLDNIEDREYIRKQWESLLRRAKLKGFAVGIAHARSFTLQTLDSLLASLPKGYGLVRVRDLMRKVSSNGNRQAPDIRGGLRRSR